jgi:hypothetical protein
VLRHGDSVVDVGRGLHWNLEEEKKTRNPVTFSKTLSLTATTNFIRHTHEKMYVFASNAG